jgi:hypothetical protein
VIFTGSKLLSQVILSNGALVQETRKECFRLHVLGQETGLSPWTEDFYLINLTLWPLSERWRSPFLHWCIYCFIKSMAGAKR